MATDLKELLNSGPDDGGAEDDTAFIGVPDGYQFLDTSRVPTPGSPAAFRMVENGDMPHPAPPQYPKGSELSLRGMSPEAIARIQQGLSLAGLIGPDTRYHLGVADPTTISRYRTLLGYANQGGVTAEEALQELIANPVDNAGSSSLKRNTSTSVNTVTLQDPATLRAAAHAAFKSATGRGRQVDDKAVDRFVREFQKQQADPQRHVQKIQDQEAAKQLEREQTLAAGGDPGNAAFSREVDVTMPDMQSRADEFARTQAPAEAGAHDISNQFNTFLKLLGGVL